MIFADTWPGKYFDLERTLALLKIGGFYVIDDMNSQPNWPEGHAEKANTLIEKLESLKDFTFTQLDWSTGVILMCEISYGDHLNSFFIALEIEILADYSI